MFRVTRTPESDVLFKYRISIEWSFRGLCGSDGVTLQARDEKAAVRKLTARLHKQYGHGFNFKVRRITKL